MNRFQAAGTSQLDPRRELPNNAYVIDRLVLTVMLLDQLGAPYAVQVAFLPNLSAEVDRPGRNVLVKIDRMDLQFSDFEEHFGTSAPPHQRRPRKHTLWRKYSRELHLG